MSINKAVGLVSVVTILGTVFACSSTTTTTPGSTGGSEDAGGSSTDSGSVVKTDGAVKKDSGGVVTTTPDAALTCTPGDLSGFTYTPQAPSKAFGQNVCTGAQVDAMIVACLSQGTASASACSAWRTANATCAPCVITGASDTTIGVFTSEGMLNRAGCLDHYKAGCGAKFGEFAACLDTACSTDEGGNCETSSDAETTECRKAANSGGCKTRSAAIDTACAGAAFDPQGAALPGDVCFPLDVPSADGGTASETGPQYYKRFTLLFCGPATVTDGGTGG